MGEVVEQQAGLTVPVRFIPVPRSISPEAQAFLGSGMNFAGPELHHTDTQGWRDYIAGIAAPLMQVAKMRAAPHPAVIVEHRLAHTALFEVVPESLAPSDSGKAILNIHGGAFIMGGGIACAYIAQPLASLTGMKSFAVDYRMPPDHPFPAGLDDCVEAYRFLLERFAPENIVLEGSSAGANLVAAAVLKARDDGLPLPAACVLHTAAVDLTGAGDTFATNAVIDIVLRRPHPETMLLYAGGHDMSHPYLSPLYGDFTKGFPPSILLAGTRDMLLSPTVMMHRALRRAGIEAELHIGEAMPHGGFGGSAPEDRELQDEIAAFVRRKLA